VDVKERILREFPRQALGPDYDENSARFPRITEDCGPPLFNDFL